MNRNKEDNRKCPLCGSSDWIKREGEDGNSIICNLCGFILSQDV
jgi:transcription initiation factor TFIIIB Brf1 subunit/transcription initiation factor TFIIB